MSFYSMCSVFLHNSNSQEFVRFYSKTCRRNQVSLPYFFLLISIKALNCLAFILVILLVEANPGVEYLSIDNFFNIKC